MQGSPESGWVLLDYGDIIVHIMTPKSRTYYDLESFWGNGTPVPLGEVIKPNVVSTAPALAEEVVSVFVLSCTEDRFQRHVWMDASCRRFGGTRKQT